MENWTCQYNDVPLLNKPSEKENRAGYTATGGAEHLDERLNEKDGRTDGRMDCQVIHSI